MTAKPLRIGIDIDGVLADYVAGIIAVGRELGLPMSGAGPNTYAMVEPGWFPDEQSALAAMRHMRDSGKLRTLALLDSGAAAAIRSLRICGHHVRVVTARHTGGKWANDERQFHATRQTIDWLLVHDIIPDDVRFHRRKSLARCDVYLDDAPRVIKELRADGRRAVVYDQPYNRHISGERVSSVTEFSELILANKIGATARGGRAIQ